MSAIHLPNILLAIPRSPVTALGLPFLLGISGGLLTGDAGRSAWYNTLRFPPGRPPRQVFPIAWTCLYLGMGYASHLAVKALDASRSPSVRSDISLGLALYYGQLLLNFAWSPLFFRAKKVGVALIDINVLLGATIWMTKLFDGATDSKTSYYLVPYCLWLSFATYLNGGIWWLNRKPSVQL